MLQSSTFLTLRSLLRDLCLKFEQFIAAELRERTLHLKEGWTEPSLTTLFECHFVPYGGRTRFRFQTVRDVEDMEK
jgi:hypothetical protein